jgi:hypothetical protein
MWARLVPMFCVGDAWHEALPRIRRQESPPAVFQAFITICTLSVPIHKIPTLHYTSNILSLERLYYKEISIPIK